MALATDTTPGSIVLAGDLTGTASAPQLRVTGVVPGSYETSNIVVDAKGRLIYGAVGGRDEASTTSPGVVQIGDNLSVSSGVLSVADSTTGVKGVAQIGGNLSVSGGMVSVPDGSAVVRGVVQPGANVSLSGQIISIANATNVVRGAVTSGNTINLSITDGEVDTGSNIPLLDTANTYTAAQHGAIEISSATTYNPDLSSKSGVILTDYATGVNVGNPTNLVDGKTFTIVCEDSIEFYGTILTASPPNLRANTLSWNGSVFCALDATLPTTRVYSSPDGVTWTARTLPSSRNWSVLAVNGGVFIAQASIGEPTAVSTDGITWTASTLPVTTGTISTIQVANGRFFNFGGAVRNTIHSSTDGVTWTSHTLSSSIVASAIAWNGTHYLLIGATTVPSIQALSSTNLSSWVTNTTSLSTVRRTVLFATGSQFSAVDPASGQTAITQDLGASWIVTGSQEIVLSTPSTTNSLQPVTHLGYRYVYGSAPGIGPVISITGNGRNWARSVISSSGSGAGVASNGTNVIMVCTDTDGIQKVFRLDQQNRLAFGSNYKFSNTATLGQNKVTCVATNADLLCTYTV